MRPIPGLAKASACKAATRAAPRRRRTPRAKPSDLNVRPADDSRTGRDWRCTEQIFPEADARRRSRAAYSIADNSALERASHIGSCREARSLSLHNFGSAQTVLR